MTNKEMQRYLIKEGVESMTAMETARLIEWLRAMGLSDSDACSCITFMATGTGLPGEKQASETLKGGVSHDE